MTMRRGWPHLLIVCAAVTAGCAGTHSALSPAGVDADRAAWLTWVMSIGAVVIWAAVVALGWYYGRPHTESPDRRRDWWLIVVGGVIVPLVVLTTLLVFGLRELPAYLARAPEGSLVVDVVGKQWWWDVRYRPAGGDEIVTANEIRLPVGEPVQFRLASDNVIHSFWIPALGGKMDMIPGRLTYLRLQPTRTGVFLGTCAEYCGTAHALMRLQVVVMEAEAFREWLRVQATDADAPVDATAARGGEAFVTHGCGACHRVRGTVANGGIGPDLTHVAGRRALGAGIRQMSAAELRRWVANASAVKPGVHMPRFDMLPPADLDALAAYLGGLR
jgi:cytochrome c oxidase subunit 2